MPGIFDAGGKTAQPQVSSIGAVCRDIDTDDAAAGTYSMIGANECFSIAVERLSRTSSTEEPARPTSVEEG